MNENLLCQNHKAWDNSLTDLGTQAKHTYPDNNNDYEMELLLVITLLSNEAIVPILIYSIDKTLEDLE